MVFCFSGSDEILAAGEAVISVLIRLLDNSGRAALLRRREIWAAQQRGPTGIE